MTHFGKSYLVTFSWAPIRCSRRVVPAAMFSVRTFLLLVTVLRVSLLHASFVLGQLFLKINSDIKSMTSHFNNSLIFNTKYVLFNSSYYSTYKNSKIFVPNLSKIQVISRQVFTLLSLVFLFCSVCHQNKTFNYI